MSTIDGLYAAFVAGKAGEGVIFLVFFQDKVVGCDLAGFNIDGVCTKDENSKTFRLELRVVAPPERSTIQGPSSGSEGLDYKLDFDLPFDFEKQPYISIMTQLGPLNLRLEKLRDLGAMQ